MSSWIVGKECIQRILTFLCDNSNKYQFSHIKRKLEELGYKLYGDSLNELGTDMYSLNYQAVNDRYNEENGLKQLFKFETLKAHDVQVLKSLQCYLYQCCEGDVPKRKLYKILREFEDSLQSYIIDKYCDYDLYEWG